LLATDIVGSSALWESETEAMQTALTEHDALIRNEIESAGGEIFKTTGDGCLAVFDEAFTAADCARVILASVEAWKWPTSVPIRIKAALHSGATIRRQGDHFGPTVNRVARLLDIAEPDTAVLSLATYALLEGMTPEGTSIRSAGHKDLKGISEPMQVFEMVKGPSRDLPQVSRPSGPRRVSGVWPASGRPFVGRQAEVETILARLGRGQAMVTVTGPGGIGKTRTVCAVVEAATARYPDGSLFVDCQSLGSEAEVALAIVEGLGGSARVGSVEEEALSLLRSRNLLLALDCYEALADHAVLPSRILAEAPGIDLVIGSRAVLGLEREAEVALQPLPLQTQVNHRGTAEALFLEMAQLADVEFQDTKENRQAIRKVCELLEGVPLLITIAAARLRHVGIADLVEQIEHQGAARLSSRHRDASVRHADIRTIVADSVRLLGSEEAAVLRDLAAFPGGALYADIEEVLGPWHSNLDWCVRRLRDHSLLLSMSTRGRKRFRLLDSVREAILEAGPPSQEVISAHAHHFGKRAELLRTLTERGEHADARYLLLSETGNLRAATAFAVTEGDKPLLRGLFRSLASGLQTCGMWEDYERLVAAARQLLGDEIQAEALGLDGALAMRKGNRSAAIAAWHRRAQICAQGADYAAYADALFDLAECGLKTSDLATAAHHVVEGLKISVQHSLPGHIATAWAVGAEIALTRGNVPVAVQRAERARLTVDGTQLAIYVHLACGRAYAAADRSHEALACFLRGVATAHRLALLLSLHHMLAEAARGFGACGDRAMEAIAWTSLVGLDRDMDAKRSAVARKELARLRGTNPGEIEDARRLVTGSGWEAGVETMLRTA